MSAQGQVNIQNKKAYFQFEILDKYSAGIILQGTEIKSVREGKVNINDAYCFFKKDELLVKNMHIAEYKQGTHYNHEPTRVRKLLLTGKELEKLQAKVKERGFTIIPLKLYLSETGYAKLEIGLARGKKVHDKRETIKSRDTKRELERFMRKK